MPSCVSQSVLLLLILEIPHCAKDCNCAGINILIVFLANMNKPMIMTHLDKDNYAQEKGVISNLTYCQGQLKTNVNNNIHVIDRNHFDLQLYMYTRFRLTELMFHSHFPRSSVSHSLVAYLRKKTSYANNIRN